MEIHIWISSNPVTGIPRLTLGNRLLFLVFLAEYINQELPANENNR